MMRNRSSFRRLARDLGGLSRSRIYRHYYRLDRDESRYSIIELGTGQGASTIALALGIVDSGRNGNVQAIDQFYQQGKGIHPAGVKEYGEDAPGINLRACCQNLSDYGVAGRVQVHPTKITDATLDIDTQGPFDMLVMDVDGFIDRDLGLFYDRLPAGGIIVIGDCRDLVNH